MVRRTIVFAGSLLAMGQSILGCNSVLGIDSASLIADSGGAPSGQESGDSGAPQPGQDGGGNAGDSGIAENYSVDCNNYCTLMQSTCKPSINDGDNTEYLGGDAGVCQAFCRLFEPSGEQIGPTLPEPMAADSLECRVWHANAAAHDAHVHCKHAGPLGGDVCNPLGGGDPCSPFCTLNLALCTGSNAQYANRDECLTACRPDGGYAGFPYEIDKAGTDLETTDLALQYQANSNTLNCRMYHLENVIYSGKPDVHCPHTSAEGGGVCSQ